MSETLMNKLIQQAKERQTYRWRSDDSYWQGWAGGSRLGGGGIEQKEKGVMDMDNSVVIAGGRGL